MNQNVRLTSQVHPGHIGPMSTAEIEEFVAKCEQDPELRVIGDFVRVLATTGLRSSDLTNLQVSKADITTGSLTISTGLDVQHSREVVLRPKEVAAILALHKLIQGRP